MAVTSTIDRSHAATGVDNLWDDSIRGIAHLALNTDDIKGTMDFYTRVMKMQLVGTKRVPYERDRGQPPYENLRHYFFNMGKDQMLAFFEYPAGLEKANRDLPGAMQHVAFHVVPEKFDAFQRHIEACGVKTIGPMSLGEHSKAFYLWDNNGIRLEVNTYLATAAAPGVVGAAISTRAKAKKELETLFDDPEDVEFWLNQMPFIESKG